MPIALLHQHPIAKLLSSHCAAMVIALAGLVGDGWMFELELSDPSELDDTLDADGYAELAGE